MQWVAYCKTVEQANNKADSLLRKGYEVAIRPSNAFGSPHYAVYCSNRKRGHIIGYVASERDAKLAVASFKNKGENAWYIHDGDKYNIWKAV